MSRILITFAFVVVAMSPSSVTAEIHELEVCEFIGTLTDDSGQAVPPGLDEELNCDHKEFLDELGLKLLDEKMPTLADMYSIGWRLIEMKETRYEEIVIWTLYLERPRSKQAK